jgi:zinc protease
MMIEGKLMRAGSFLIAIGLILSNVLPSTDAGAQQKSDRYQLENGLTVILCPVTGAVETALVVMYSMGGDQDPKGMSGLAHLIEHAYVTAAAGSEKARTADEFANRYNGAWNAQTGDRHTLIATVFSPSALEKELQDAAARMNDLHITTADLDREKPRVLFELNNTFNLMSQLAAMNTARELVRPTPLGGRRGGVPEQVSAITAKDAQERWQRFYKPRNAIVSLAGSVDIEQARKTITEYFAKIPSGDAAPAPQEPGAPRFGATQEIPGKPNDPTGVPQIWLAYRAPQPGSDLYVPFLVLTGRLLDESFKIGVGDDLPVHYTALDDPAVVHIGLPLIKDAIAKQTQAKLESFVASTFQPELNANDVKRVLREYGPLLGLSDFAGTQAVQNPYLLAFSLGRCRQLGIDSAGLKKRLDSLTDKDLRIAAKEIFAPEKHAAVVIASKKD